MYGVTIVTDRGGTGGSGGDGGPGGSGGAGGGGGSNGGCTDIWGTSYRSGWGGSGGNGGDGQDGGDGGGGSGGASICLVWDVSSSVILVDECDMTWLCYPSIPNGGPAGGDSPFCGQRGKTAIKWQVF
jgi:hypothetical protein